MPAYTGPVPPPPGQQADAATWQNWWSYQTILQNLRYEDERAARVIVTDRQHLEKMAAEAACAAATKALADAQQALAAAMLRIHAELPAPAPAPTPAPPVAGLVAETVGLAKRWQQQFTASGLVYLDPNAPPNIPPPTDEAPLPLPVPKPPQAL